MKELREACDQMKLILTVTVPSNPSVIEKNYPVEDLQRYAHYVILSANEFRKLKKTSLIAPLYSLTTGSSNSLVSRGGGQIYGNWVINEYLDLLDAIVWKFGICVLYGTGLLFVFAVIFFSVVLGLQC